MFDFNSNEGYFLHLIKSALKDEQPKEKPEGVSWEEVLKIAERQTAANLCWFSIEKLNNKPDGELYTYWQDVYAKAASKCLKQMMEIDLLCNEFTSRGYDIMFLKGSKIREYYPSPDMRTMTDIDLLVKADQRQPIREIMKSLGYEVDLLDDGQVDAFKKKPVIYTEIHYDFSAENHIYHEIFTIDWDKLVETQTPHIFEMTFEDLYFFNIGHYAKNMHNKGMGIRAILDCYILWNAATEEQKQNILDKIEKAELGKFHGNLLKIMDIWFNNAEDDGKLDAVQEYLITRHTFGDEKTLRVLQTMYAEQTSSNTEYLRKKIFPSATSLYERYRLRKRFFILLPFLWLRRIFGLIFGGKEKWQDAKSQVDVFKTIEQEDIDYERKIRQEFGLM
ncbi:MAG: nucleotidyltransferase family protein [Eubacterium sp.]|nr:nucleotidyltransferase family protein [Eubacterium sp.]